MKIEAIRYQFYNSRGQLFSKDSRGRKKEKRPHTLEKNKPIDAITFETVQINQMEQKAESEVSLLTQLVKSLPESYVKERMDQLRDSYPIIDDFLVEKLIMEAI